LSSKDEQDFDRLAAAWRDFQAAIDESSIAARLAFFKHYPSANAMRKPAVETTAAPIRPYGEEVAPAGPWRVVRYGSPPDKGDMIFDEHGCIAHFGDQHHEAVGRIVYEHNVSLVNVNDKA
jgi:hypothetical protein